MKGYMRWIAIVVAVIGLVVLVFGIMLIPQSSSAKKEIASEIQPVKLEEVNAKYDAVKVKQVAIMQQEEPQIQAGKAAPSAMYIYLTGQRTSLGLAKSNIGLTGLVQTIGIINIILGVGVILAGVVLFKKSR